MRLASRPAFGKALIRNAGRAGDGGLTIAFIIGKRRAPSSGVISPCRMFDFDDFGSRRSLRLRQRDTPKPAQWHGSSNLLFKIRRRGAKRTVPTLNHPESACNKAAPGVSLPVHQNTCAHTGLPGHNETTTDDTPSCRGLKLPLPQTPKNLTQARTQSQNSPQPKPLSYPTP
jgi:hypothetical protein